MHYDWTCKWSLGENKHQRNTVLVALIISTLKESQGRKEEEKDRKRGRHLQVFFS